MTARSLRLRIAVSAGVIAMAFAVLAVRAVQLTVVEGDELRRLAHRQHRKRVPLPPARGPIVDRSGEPLALTRESVAVYMRPHQVEAGPEVLSMVGRLLGVPPHVVLARAASSARFTWLDRQVPLDRWAAVEELSLAGIGSESTRLRHYPHGPLAGHVLGFTGIDGQALEGIERRLDSELRGEEADLVFERDARGHGMAVDGRGRMLPRVGSKVELTIDLPLQLALESKLQAAVKSYAARAATGIVLDPHTGEILAMANVPRFDPNHFREASPDQWRNRAVTDTFEPGSTFKAFLAAAALENGVLTPETEIFCEKGSYRVGGRTIHDHHPQETLTFAEVIQKSSNIGCAKVAERLGARRYAEVIDAFGFGRPTGVDLPGETAGLVQEAARWRPIKLATISYGQGISVTPIQLVRAFAAIANGGKLLRPYIVRRITGADGTSRYRGRPLVEAHVISPHTAKVLTRILRGAVENGTGSNARLDGFAVAGKTGTAQKVDPGSGRYSRDDRMSSFVGFVPADDPKLAILVVVDSPRRATYGGVVAAPVFREVAEVGLERRGVRPWSPPVPDLEPPALQVAEGAPPRLADSSPAEPLAGPESGAPRFLGLSLREALIKAQRAGLLVRVEGNGYVESQEPPPGADLPDDEILLRLGSHA